MSTIRDNKLIAEFMGGIVQPDETCKNYGKMSIPRWAFIEFNFDALKVGGYGYFISWDWLMPVVMKIEELNNCSYGFTVDPWGIEIIEYVTGKEEVIVKIERFEDETKLHQYYRAVIEFIYLLNKSK